MTAFNKIKSLLPSKLHGKRPSIFPRSSHLFYGRGQDTEVLNQFKEVSTLWKALTVRAETFASVDWQLYRTHRRTGVKTPVLRHPALELLQRPNLHQSGFDFRVTTSLLLDLVGKLFVYKPVVSPFPYEMYLLRPDRVTIDVADDGSSIRQYNYLQPNGLVKEYEPELVSRMRLPHPFDLLDGVGAVETLLTELCISRMSKQWQSDFFRDSAAPRGVYSFQEPLEPDEFTELALRIQGRDSTERDIILDNAAKYSRVDFSMDEMQFPELREQSRDTILEGTGVPKTFLGQATDVNKASASALERVYSKYELTPSLIRYRDWLNWDLLTLFPGSESLSFNFDNPVKKDMEDISKAVDALEKLVNLGVNRDQALEYLGLETLEFDERPQLAAPVDYTPEHEQQETDRQLV